MNVHTISTMSLESRLIQYYKLYDLLRYQIRSSVIVSDVMRQREKINKCFTNTKTTLHFRLIIRLTRFEFRYLYRVYVYFYYECAPVIGGSLFFLRELI